MNILFKRLASKYKKWKLWSKYGNHTFFHLDNKETIIIDGVETHGVPIVHQYDNSCVLHIGRYCSIAAGCQIILGGNHHTNWVSTYAFYQEPDKFPRFSELGQENSVSHGNISIGNDVWIGRNVTILPGATIGDGAVIGAGSVVAGKIPPYSVAVGNPCRVARCRFTEEQVKKLEKIAWWNWPYEKINDNLHLICSDNIEMFANKWGGGVNSYVSAA